MRDYKVVVTFGITAKNLKSASKKFAPVAKAIKKIDDGNTETLIECTTLEGIVSGKAKGAFKHTPMDIVGGTTNETVTPQERAEKKDDKIVTLPSQSKTKPKKATKKKPKKKKETKKETYWFCCPSKKCKYEKKALRKPKLSATTKRKCPKCGKELEVCIEE